MTAKIFQRATRVVLLFACFLSSIAFATPKLPSFVARYDRQSGFIRPPEAVSIFLQRNHTVLYQARDQYGKLVRSYYLATLSNRAFSNALKKISAVSSSSPLVDQNPGGGFCSDHASTMISIIVGDHESLTMKDQNCHIFTLEDHSADAINEIMQGFAELGE